jgi:hypothetical protein
MNVLIRARSVPEQLLQFWGVLVDQPGQLVQPPAGHVVRDGSGVIQERNVGSLTSGHEKVDLVHVREPRHGHELDVVVQGLLHLILDVRGLQTLVRLEPGRGPVEQEHRQRDRRFGLIASRGEGKPGPGYDEQDQKDSRKPRSVFHTTRTSCC